MASVLDLIKHYQHSIEKNPNDEQRVLRCINKLHQLGVTVQHLQDTGVGRTVNALRKEPGDVGTAARALVNKWKLMVAAEESSEPEEDNHDASKYNGHNGKDSDESVNQSRQGDYEREREFKASTKSSNYKHINGDHGGSKRKYQSSEDEEYGNKRSRYPQSSEDEKYDHMEDTKMKIEPSNNESDRDNDLNMADSQSEESETSEESEHEREVKKEDNNKTKSHLNKYSSGDHSDHKSLYSSSSSKNEQITNKHSTHYSSSEKYSSKEKPISKHKSPSDKRSSEKYAVHEPKKSNTISPAEHSNSSGKHKSKSDKHKSHKSEKHSHKSESHSDTSETHKSYKQKHDKSEQKEKSSKDNSMSKESRSKNKESRSSEKEKEKFKDRSSSSKEKSSHSHKNKDEKRHLSSDSKSKSHSDSKSKSGKAGDNSSEKNAKHKSSSSSSHKSSKSSKVREEVPKKKKTQTKNGDSDDGIDCGSGASFAEALGMISPTKAKKKSLPKEFTEGSTSFEQMSAATLLAPTAKLTPLPPLEISALPEISPNYKPRPPPKLLPHFTDEETMGAAISSKNQRTKVYSGNKTYGKLPTLYELCVQILQDNIDALEFTGGVPYDILKPVVDKATPSQLFTLEHYNPYLMDDTDHLWQKFCEKHFRNKKRLEMETWREMYMRCQEEQECKLKSLTANIKMAQDAKNAPVKQTKMAYVDSVVKPPRSIARKQAIHGTARMAAASPAARVAALAGVANVVRAGTIRPPPATPTSSSAAIKPKKAPLMQKALQFMRGRKR